jgi:hypothetical protein
MTKSQKNVLAIQTSKINGVICEIYVSPLDFLMIKLDNLDGTYTTYNLGKYDPKNNIFINELNKKL